MDLLYLGIEVLPFTDRGSIQGPDIILNLHMRPPATGDPIPFFRYLIRDADFWQHPAQIVAAEGTSHAIEE